MHHLSTGKEWVGQNWRSVGLPCGSDSKASAYNSGHPGSIPVSGRSPRRGNGNPLQYSCLENHIDQGAWWATVHGVAKSRTQLSDFTSLHFTSGLYRGFPGSSADKRILPQCRRPQFNSWVRKISWTRDRLPTPVFMGFPGGLDGKNVMRETQVWSLGREDPLEKGTATHSSILARRIPWTEEPGGLWSVASQWVGPDWSDLAQ